MVHYTIYKINSFKLTLVLPNKCSINKIKYFSNSGNFSSKILSEGVLIKKLSIKSMSSDINICEKNVFESMKIKTMSGSIIIGAETCTNQNVDLETMSGMVFLDLTDVGEIIANMTSITSSPVNIHKPNGRFNGLYNVSTMSGSIIIN